MQIWEKLKSAPEDGAESLVAAYSERLYKFAYRLCGDASRSEDLAIRTLAKAVRANGNFASEQAYFTFLCAILVNLHRDDMRLKAANALNFMDEPPEVEDDRPDPAAVLSDKSDAEILRLAIARLSPILRETVVLRYYSALSVADIAEVLAVPEGTVKFRLSEARRKIREFLTQRKGGFTR